MLAPELESRARALEATGFTIVEADAWSFVAVRSKWWWDLAMHLTHVLWVRRVQNVTVADTREGQARVKQLGDEWEPCKLPRGFQHGRALVDVIVADAVDPEAAAYARATVGKGMGQSVQTALVPAAGGPTIVSKPIFGAAFWAKTKHAVEVAASARPSDAPLSMLGLFIALTVMYPGIAILGLMCCGVPILWPAFLLMNEKTPPSVLPAPGSHPGGP